MRLQTLTIALLATLAIACVPPQSKSKGSKSTQSGISNTEMPDDSLSNNAAGTNNTTGNNTTGTNNTSLTNNDTSGPVCGDGVIEGAEACDLDTSDTCVSLGFDGGTATCGDDCQVDTTECFRVSCGDGVVQAAEVCDDGADNGTYDACGNNCSGLGQYCGDRVVNGPEACDGAPPNGVTCRALGFDGGTIMCTDCGVDTTACTTCGDGLLEPGEACDDGGLNGTYGHCNALCTGLGASCGDGIRNGNEACDGADLGGATCASAGAGRGNAACSATCQVDLSACSLTPITGEVIISEVMQNPNSDLDNDGEYFELYNTTTGDLDLSGCVIQSSTASGPESFDIIGTLIISSGQHAVFARSSNASFVPDYIYNGAINLNNSVDELSLRCDGVEIDAISYDDGATFPDPTGASMSLSPSAHNATSNDSGYNWCESTSVFGLGDRGTPGYGNDPCF